MAKQLFGGMPGMGASRPSLPKTGGMPGGAMLQPGNAPKGKAGAKRGMPNFKSRITKPGGMKSGGKVKDKDNDGMATGGAVEGSGGMGKLGKLAKGGKVGKCMATGGAVMAGQGSGIGRLKRSK